jgi:hypothetical protein
VKQACSAYSMRSWPEGAANPPKDLRHHPAVRRDPRRALHQRTGRAQGFARGLRLVSLPVVRADSSRAVSLMISDAEGYSIAQPLIFRRTLQPLLAAGVPV